MDKVLLVIPAYNEEKNIERVVDHIKNDFPELDYVVVNDGSKDDTAAICRRRGYNFIDLPVNLGLAGCFQTGMKYAWLKGYSYAVQFDGDGQHRPEYIKSMKEKMDEGYDIVIGSRFVTEKKSWSMRMLGSRLIGTAIWLTTGAKIKDPTSGMRLFSRKMIGEFAWNLNYGPEPDTVSFLIRQGAKIAEVQVTIDDRTAGESYLKPLSSKLYGAYAVIHTGHPEFQKALSRLNMKNLTKRLLYKGDNVARANVIWNIAGSFVYAFASMVLSFLVIRMAGEEKGGIFSFGYSTLGQQLFLVAYFGIRPFQITDGKGEYSFGEYREHRNMTCMLALVAGALFLTARTIAFRKGIGDYTAGKCMILLLLVIYKVIDGYADVYESEFQRQGCLYLTGKSNFFRTIFSVAVFTVTLGAFNHLLFACLMAVAAQAMGVFLFDLDVIHALDHVDWTITKGKVAKLFKNTGFLFVSVFLDFYIFSSAKYAIDAHMNNAASGYFNLIFMPTSVIYMVANFVIRPYLTTLTDLWTEEKITEFKKTLVRIAAVILGLTVLAVAGTLVLGKWALSLATDLPRSFLFLYEAVSPSPVFPHI